MLDALRRFVRELGISPAASAAGTDDSRLSVAALLYHAIAVDGFVTEEEADRIRAVLKQHFGIDDNEAASLVAAGKVADLEAIDLYKFTSTLKHRLDYAGRLAVVAMLWEVVFADGHLHEFEDNVVWRVAELLGIAPRDRIALKKSATRGRISATDDPPA